MAQVATADIIGGVETDGYKPTLHYRTAYFDYDEVSGEHRSTYYDGSCTATRVAPRAIITAAHCFIQAYEAQLIRNQKYPGRIFKESIESNPPLIFSDTSINAERVVIHPKYKALIEVVLEKKKKIYSIPSDRCDLECKNEKLKELETSRIYVGGEFDMALIHTKESSPHYYPLYMHELKRNRYVEIVGFGYPEVASYLVDLYKEKKRVLETMLKVLDANKEISEQLSAELLEVNEEISRMDGKKRKRVGYNKIFHHNQGRYLLVGRVRGSQTELWQSLSKGDSGGGLLVTKNEKRYVAGVASYTASLEDRDERASFFAKTSNLENKRFLKRHLERGGK